MEWLLVGLLVAFPLVWLGAAASYAYRDAPRYDMNPRKWAAVSFFVPLFGFFAYLFEREERMPDTDDREDHFVDGPFQIHKSRAGDTPLATAPEETDDDSENRDER